MKRFCALCMSLFMFIGCISLPAAATEINSEPAEVGVFLFYQDGPLVFDGTEVFISPRSETVHDLSDSTLSLDWTIPGEGSLQSSLCKTNTTKIYVSVDLNRDASIKVELLDSEGNSLAETTFTFYLLDEKTPTVKFTNLTSSKNYRIKITNNSQNQIHLYGGIRDSLLW